MKKTTITLIILFLLFSFSSCKNSNPDSDSIQEDATINETEEDMPGTESSEAGIDNSSDDSTETILPGTEIEDNTGNETNEEYNPYEIKHIELKGVEIPMVCEEAQFVLYAIMELWQPKRRWKREIIQEYVSQRKIKNRQIVKDSTSQRIPGYVKKIIKDILL